MNYINIGQQLEKMQFDTTINTFILNKQIVKTYTTMFDLKWFDIEINPIVYYNE